MTTTHYRNAQGALLFYDITDESSFKNIKNWLEAICKHTDEGIVIMLVGNKLDLVEK